MKSTLLATRRLALTLGFTLLAPLAARAGDFYVDATGGSDANGGTSPTDAWQTITHAMGQLPVWDQTVHLAPGVYDTALGEVFPIELQYRATLLGDEGPDVTIIDAGGASLVLDGSGVDHACLQGIWLRNATVGVDVELFPGAEGWLEFQDVVISNMQRGISGYVMGMNLGTTTMLWVELFDTTIRDCSAEGIYLRAESLFGDTDWSGAQLECQDSRIEGCGIGLHLESDGHVESAGRAFLVRTVVATNGIGVRADDLNVDRSTITANTSDGLCAFESLNIENSIVWANGDDLGCVGWSSTISYSDIGDGSAGGMNGNIAADPLFVDAGGGDYRLRFWSPCVDSADPTYVLDTIDGNLDGAKRLDMGAFELAPLDVSGEARIGQSFFFELWGPAGGTALVYVSPGDPAGPPFPTPFGGFELARQRAVKFGLSATGPGPPGLLLVQVPNLPALIGETYSFQALSTSTVPTPPQAWTNTLAITIQP